MFNKTMIVVATFFLVACGGGGSESNSPVLPPVSSTEDPVISQFSFLVADNPELAEDINLQINDQMITGRLAINSPVNNLVASIQHQGSTLKVDAVTQSSGSTANDFTGIVDYSVTTDDGRSATYSVDLTRFTGLPVIYLSTDGNLAIDSKEDYMPGTVIIDGGRNFEGLPEAEMKIRGRGNSTWFLHPK